MLFLGRLNPRLASLIRAGGLILIGWSVLSATHQPTAAGRGLVVAIAFALAAVSWLVWMARIDRELGVTGELYVLAGAGGVLLGASPASAASAFVFVAIVAAALRSVLTRAVRIVALGTFASGVSVLIYDGSGLGLLAYTLGFAATLLAASNARESLVRAEQAELLLAQTQRSHEEQLRAARLEESARIARDMHDVLAHSLAGLTIQLEATGALLDQGAPREQIRARIDRALELAREGLRETRRAVGALRGEPVSACETIRSLIAEYRESTGADVQLRIEGDSARLTGPEGETLLRAVQEALTNTRKHAPGADVSVVIDAGEQPGEGLAVVIEDRANPTRSSPEAPVLAASGGGFGLLGMRERAESLGGTLSAGAGSDGWRVELRLPSPAARVSRG